MKKKKDININKGFIYIMQAKTIFQDKHFNNKPGA